MQLLDESGSSHHAAPAEPGASASENWIEHTILGSAVHVVGDAVGQGLDAVGKGLSGIGNEIHGVGVALNESIEKSTPGLLVPVTLLPCVVLSCP
jgi:hypothetical protein